MKEKIKRNDDICDMFLNLNTVKSIASKHKLSESTVKIIIIRRLGIKTFEKTRKKKIIETSKKYNIKNYLKNRKIFNKK